MQVCGVKLFFFFFFFSFSFSTLKIFATSNWPVLDQCCCCSVPKFSSESALDIKWPKYWSFSFSVNPSNEYSGLISFRIDSFDLLVAPVTLKSLLQHHNLKASIIWSSAFFKVQHKHLYMTTGKTIALTRWTFVGKVMSLLFNMLSNFGQFFFQAASVF